jgi:flagellar motor switch protein FliG
VAEADNEKLEEPVIAGPGALRAAAVLVGLGPNYAAQLFRHLDESTVRRIALGAKGLRKGGAMVPEALREFVVALEAVGGDAAAGDNVLREVVTQVLGAEKARRAFDGIGQTTSSEDLLSPIANADSEALAMVLAREQPQTVALVLGAMDRLRATDVMKRLPDFIRGQVLSRLATLESVSPEILREVAQALAIELRASASSGMRQLDGKSAAVDLLRRSPVGQQTEAVQAIERDDPDLAAELRSKLFTFDDLVNLSDRDVQTFLREVDTSRLAVALKAAPTTVRDKIFKNMSTRGSQMLQDDISAMGPTKLAAVDEAQGELVKIAFMLAEQGRITLIGPADKMV